MRDILKLLAFIAFGIGFPIINLCVEALFVLALVNNCFLYSIMLALIVQAITSAIMTYYADRRDKIIEKIIFYCNAAMSIINWCVIIGIFIYIIYKILLAIKGALLLG